MHGGSWALSSAWSPWPALHFVGRMALCRIITVFRLEKERDTASCLVCSCVHREHCTHLAGFRLLRQSCEALATTKLASLCVKGAAMARPPPDSIVCQQLQRIHSAVGFVHMQKHLEGFASPSCPISLVCSCAAMTRKRSQLAILVMTLSGFCPGRQSGCQHLLMSPSQKTEFTHSKSMTG